MLKVFLIRVDPHEDVSGPHEIDDDKLSRFIAALIGGETFPPVRLVDYGDTGYQIIDGHHRVAACQTVEHSFDALVAAGDEFEQLDIDLREKQEDKRADDIEFWTITDPDMECACGAKGCITETIEKDTFPVGAAPDPVIDVKCEVPVLTCLQCGFQWTDYRAEEIRDKAAREQTPYYKADA